MAVFAGTQTPALQVEGTKECFKEVLSLQASFRAHAQAVATLRDQYVASEDQSDFATKLEELASQRLQAAK